MTLHSRRTRRRATSFEARESVPPLSSEYGMYKTVKAKIWLGFIQGQIMAWLQREPAFPYVSSY